MAKVVLRFYGRFVYSVGFKNDAETGIVQVLAPNFDTARFGVHHPVMTIRRDKVDLRPGKTTASPFRRWVNDNVEILESEYLSWDLTGLNVAFRSAQTNGAKLERFAPEQPNPPAKGLILNLPDLENEKGRTAILDAGSLSADVNGKTSAVITVSQGTGIPHIVSPTDSVFLLEYGDAADGDPRDLTTVKDVSQQPIRFQLADRVEFSFDLPTGVTKLIFVLTDPHTGHTGRVVASTTSANDPTHPKPDDTVTVSFSHHCVGLPPFERPYDFEFFQYYNVLDTPLDALDTSLVPKTAVTGGEAGDCDAKARLDYDVTTLKGRPTPP